MCTISSLNWEEALDRLGALLVIPETSTWERSRHRRHTGPQPLRNSSWPWGFPWLGPRDRETVESVNARLRQQFSWMNDCVRKRPSSPMIMVHPEDLGSADNGFPASIWQLPEVKLWANKWGLRRYGTRQCNFGKCDWPHPVGVLSTHPLPHHLFSPGWPTFHAESGRYCGPLSRHCRCPRNQHLSDSSFMDRNLRKRTSPLLQHDFMIYLATFFAQPAALQRSGAKLCRRGSVDEQLVRADWASDSDETDAGQADINWEALDLKELGENHGPPRATLDLRAMEALGINDRYPLWDTSEEQEARFTGTARRASPQDYEAVEESRDQDFSAKAPNTEGLLRTKGEMRSKNATGSGTASDSKGEVKSKNATGSGFVSDEKIVTDLPENVHQELKEQAQKKATLGRHCEPRVLQKKQ